MKYSLLIEVKQKMVDDPHVLCRLVHSGKLTQEQAKKYRNKILREEIVKAKYLMSEFEYLNDLVYEYKLDRAYSKMQLLEESEPFDMDAILAKGKKLSQEYSKLRDDIKKISFKDPKFSEISQKLDDTISELSKLAKEFYKHTINKKSVMGTNINLIDASANPKMFKSLVDSIGKATGDNRGVMTFALYLTAAFPLAKHNFETSDKTSKGTSLTNTCPQSSQQCRETCLTYAGGKVTMDSKLRARYRKTWWWAIDENEFDVEPVKHGDLLLDINSIAQEQEKEREDIRKATGVKPPAKTLDLNKISNEYIMGPREYEKNPEFMKNLNDIINNSELNGKQKSSKINELVGKNYKHYRYITNTKGKWSIKFKKAKAPFGYIDTYDTSGNTRPTKETFIKKLKTEILALKQFGDKYKFKIEVRLNGTSDIDLYKDLSKFKSEFDGVDFYDYTKVPTYILRSKSQEAEKLLKVHYVFSRADNNNQTATFFLEHGLNVSFVFEKIHGTFFKALYSNPVEKGFGLESSVRKHVVEHGFTLETFNELKNKVKEIEESGHSLDSLFDIYHGGLPYYFYGIEVIDGDTTDARRLDYDEQSGEKGKIIGLIEKGDKAQESTRSKRSIDVPDAVKNNDISYFREFIIRTLDLLRFKPEVFFKEYSGPSLSDIFPPKLQLADIKGNKELLKNIDPKYLPGSFARNISIESIDDSKLRKIIKNIILEKYGIK